MGNINDSVGLKVPPVQKVMGNGNSKMATGHEVTPVQVLLRVTPRWPLPYEVTPAQILLRWKCVMSR
jgi:hypothetical protein